MARFLIKCVPHPKWAREPDVWLHDMRLADYHAIQKHRVRMLKVVHKEVETCLNTAGLYYDGEEDGFPNRSRMTGEYYLSDESYTARVGPVWFQVSVMCRCLGSRLPGSAEVGDYLGLEVWLKCDPKKWAFEVFRNTDSSLI